MDLDRFVAALVPVEVVGETRVEVQGLAYDNRQARPGTLFFCVPGERADGHDFAAGAVERGAAALVVERALGLPVPQLVVGDTRASMAIAADLFFAEPTRELAVAAVTGTNGKTTTVYLLREILAVAGRRPGLLSTVECRIGDEVRPVVRTTPEAIDLQRLFREMLDQGCSSCAIEASSHASELHRLDRVRFAALGFTNLSQDHLDFHGTMERYFEAKRRLFMGSGEPPAAVNVGDPWGQRLAADLRAIGHERVLTFARESPADLRPSQLELTREGIRMRIGELELSSRLRGAFNAENVLAAVAIARLLGIEDGAVSAGIEALAGVPGRLEPVEEGQPFLVLVDYAHTPDGLARVLGAARELGQGRLICVFGCGGDRDRDKRPLMGEIASSLADLAVVTSDNPRSEDPRAIIAEIVAGAVAPLEVEPDRRKAVTAAIEAAREGDVVVIAGKGHELGQEIAGEKLPFDDRVVAREALRAAAARA
ncbi:MAG: UDP-N-acetylmuramoyl-L-alanyl-D-glutamate--2,6-diaminopimelate ligase [Gaiellaceae bacterium]